MITIGSCNLHFECVAFGITCTRPHVHANKEENTVARSSRFSTAPNTQTYPRHDPYRFWCRHTFLFIRSTNETMTRCGSPRIANIETKTQKHSSRRKRSRGNNDMVPRSKHSICAALHGDFVSIDFQASNLCPNFHILLSITDAQSPAFRVALFYLSSADESRFRRDLLCNVGNHEHTRLILVQHEDKTKLWFGMFCCRL